MSKFKVGDKVIAREGSLQQWGRELTRNKVYIVVEHPTYNNPIVYGDISPNYWSNPHEYFDKIIHKNIIGGTLFSNEVRSKVF